MERQWNPGGAQAPLGRFPNPMTRQTLQKLKAKRVDPAQDWEWSSLGCAPALRAEVLDPWPVDRPRNWLALVNQPISETESWRPEKGEKHRLFPIKYKEDDVAGATEACLAMGEEQPLT